MFGKYLALCIMAASVLGCQWEKKPAPPQQVIYQPVIDTWPAGTVFVSRNKLESDNTSPGYWNHLSVYIGNGRIVESQSDRGVILTPIQEWLGRDYIWFPLYPIDLTTGEKAAARAATLIGLPYREISSLAQLDRNENLGLNCVSVAKISYEYALNRRIAMPIADSAEKLTDVFSKRDPRFIR